MSKLSQKDISREIKLRIAILTSIQIGLSQSCKEKLLGTIENSTHIPRGMLEFWLDPESPYYKTELAPEKPKILFCASNWRSALAVKSLNEMGFKNVSHVAGGYEALLKSGFKIKNI